MHSSVTSPGDGLGPLGPPCRSISRRRGTLMEYELDKLKKKSENDEENKGKVIRSMATTMSKKREIR